MFVILKKKNILLGLVVVLAVSFLTINFMGNRDQVTLNRYFEQLEHQNREQSEETIPVNSPIELSNEIEVNITSNYFVEYKLERDRIRSRQIEILREIVNNPNSVSENRMEAQQRLFLVSDNMEKELELENLLTAKGFSQTAVLIQPSVVTIVVGKTNLNHEEIARIADVAVKTTNFDLENIVIVPLQEGHPEQVN